MAVAQLAPSIPRRWLRLQRAHEIGGRDDLALLGVELQPDAERLIAGQAGSFAVAAAERDALSRSSQQMAESCAAVNIIVTIMKWSNCRFSIIKSKEFVLLWIERREELEASTNELFNVVASGKVRINVNQRLALKGAADAHKALEARATSGSTVLTIEPTIHRSFP